MEYTASRSEVPQYHVNVHNSHINASKAEVSHTGVRCTPWIAENRLRKPKNMAHEVSGLGIMVVGAGASSVLRARSVGPLP